MESSSDGRAAFEADAGDVSDASHCTRDAAPEPPELVVHDEINPCPYLPGMDARMPLRLPLRTLTRTEFDQQLIAGNRRHGKLVYRTECPSCRACEPIRVLVNEFAPG